MHLTKKIQCISLCVSGVLGLARGRTLYLFSTPCSPPMGSLKSAMMDVFSDIVIYDKKSSSIKKIKIF